MIKKTIADAMKKHFVKSIKKLKLKKVTLLEILDRYKDHHQSIVKTQFQMNGENNFFSFKPVTSCPKNHKVTLSQSK